MAVLLTCVVIICELTITNGNEFDLKELKHTVDDPISADDTRLDIVKHILGLDAAAELDLANKAKIAKDSKLSSTIKLQDETKFRYHIAPDDDKTAQTARKYPQWVVSFYSNTLIVFIRGTTSSWDWRNMVDIVPKKIDISQFNYKDRYEKSQHPMLHFKPIEIQIHRGMYNGINTKKFYELLFDDIAIIMQTNDVKKFVFSGHSQGGGMATEWMILWKTKVLTDCRNYAETLFAGKKLLKAKPLLDTMEVITFGSAPCIISGFVSNLEKAYPGIQNTVYNFIHAEDPGPMILMGDKAPASQPIRAEGGLTLFNLAISPEAAGLNEYHNQYASFHPFGHYVVVLPVGKKKWALKTLTGGTDLYIKHLVEGSETFVAKSSGDLSNLANMYFQHRFAAYMESLGQCIPVYLGVIKTWKHQGMVYNPKNGHWYKPVGHAYREYENLYKDEVYKYYAPTIAVSMVFIVMCFAMCMMLGFCTGIGCFIVVSDKLMERVSNEVEP